VAVLRSKGDRVVLWGAKPVGESVLADLLFYDANLNSPFVRLYSSRGKEYQVTWPAEFNSLQPGVAQQVALNLWRSPKAPE